MISPLLTDLYQLTMAYGYWKLGLHERKAVFHLIFRKNPFKGNYAIAAGLETVVDFLNHYQFQEDDLQYLATLRTPDAKAPLFTADFLSYLKTLRFTGDLDAMPEGTLVFPNEPLLRVKGPLIQCQLLESTLLNIINFQTLIATKASRVYQAVQGGAILEFGMRRAQGPDGALSASRASYIGGCDATSNVLAGKCFDIPVRGTHAHSWVTVFPNELSAFFAYARVMPHNCVLLVDTYHTIQGVKNAIQVGKKLREEGYELQGIRLDSGDLAKLSIEARAMLDAAGFQQTKIIASNSLDEYVIQDAKNKGAKIDIWGVGTHLAVAYDHPALDGVYKLSAIENESGEWVYKLKLSEESAKISNPGIHQVKRFYQNDVPLMDMLFDEEKDIQNPLEMYTLDERADKITIPSYNKTLDLLNPIFQEGQCLAVKESIHEMRKRSLNQMNAFLSMHKNKMYPVGLEKNLYEIKQQLIKAI